MKKKRTFVIPSCQLSPYANHDVFSIPFTKCGKIICNMHVVWGVVQGRVQPCIFNPMVYYYGFRPATSEEIQSELKRRERDEGFKEERQIIEISL